MPFFGLRTFSEKAATVERWHPLTVFLLYYILEAVSCIYQCFQHQNIYLDLLSCEKKLSKGGNDKEGGGDGTLTAHIRLFDGDLTFGVTRLLRL